MNGPGGASHDPNDTPEEVAATPGRNWAPGDKEPRNSEGAKVTRKPRGFAAISPERRREIASKGGKAAHAAGTAHQFSSDEARNAGRKGGTAPHIRRGRGKKTPTPEATS